jgi:hypothetical protein
VDAGGALALTRLGCFSRDKHSSLFVKRVEDGGGKAFQECEQLSKWTFKFQTKINQGMAAQNFSAIS